MEKILNLGYFHKNDSHLDYGCGRGFDITYLGELGIFIDGFDKYSENRNHNTLKKNKYDLVLCNYVLNVIKDLKEHEEVIRHLKRLSDNVIITVRSDTKTIKPNWEYISNNKCYKTTRGSYQRFYDEGLVEELVGDVEYIEENRNYLMFKLK